jgi:hypothetical protein
LKNRYDKCLEDLFITLERAFPEFDRNEILRLCNINETPLTSQDRLRADEEFFISIKDTARNITTESALREAIIIMAEHGESKCKKGTRNSLGRNDWLMLALVSYLQFFKLQGSDLYGAVIAFTVYAGGVKAEEWGVEEEFDIFGDSIPVDRIKKRVSNRRMRIGHFLVTEAMHQGDLKQYEMCWEPNYPEVNRELRDKPSNDGLFIKTSIDLSHARCSLSQPSFYVTTRPGRRALIK